MVGCKDKSEKIMSYELIKGIAEQKPDIKFGFTKRRYKNHEYGDHWVEQYNIFNKPHGKKLFEITNSYGDFAIDGVPIDVMDSWYSKCAIAARVMDGYILKQEKAFDDLLYNHNHEFVVTHNQSGQKSFINDGVYRVWLDKKLQFIVTEQNNLIYLNRPKMMKCYPFNIIIPTQALINLLNRQK